MLKCEVIVEIRIETERESGKECYIRSFQAYTYIFKCVKKINTIEYIKLSVFMMDKKDSFMF